VLDARNAVEAGISDWNIAHSKRSRLTLVPVRWETHAVPEAGSDPQSILNRQLVARCDLLVAVFGGRLGTATPRAPSGTAEEIDEFIRSGKPVLLYVVGANRSGADPDQLAALDKYLGGLRQRALLSDVATVEELWRAFTRHLPQKLEPFLGTAAPNPAPAVLDAAALQALKLLFRDEGSALLEAVADALGVQGPTAEYHLRRLESAGLVESFFGGPGELYFALTQQGRSELFSRGLLT
jgi:DNA-binding transcriptional ArsR family regulator